MIVEMRKQENIMEEIVMAQQDLNVKQMLSTLADIIADAVHNREQHQVIVTYRNGLVTTYNYMNGSVFTYRYQ